MDFVTVFQVAQNPLKFDMLTLLMCVALLCLLRSSRCVNINSLAFSHDSLFLCASSNTETVHIFKLEMPKEGWVPRCATLRSGVTHLIFPY